MINKIITIIMCFAISQTGIAQDIMDAVKMGQFCRAAELLRQGANVKVVDKNGANLLMWCIKTRGKTYVESSCREDVIFQLIKQGSDCSGNGVIWLDEQKKAYYGSPLVIAAAEGDYEIVKYLLDSCSVAPDEREFDPISRSRSGWTAMEWIFAKVWDGSSYWESPYFSYDLKDIAELLVSKGSKVNRQYKSEPSPLLYATKNGHYNTGPIEFMLENGVDVNATTSSGWTALHFAARDGAMDAARVILENGANADAASTTGWTPLLLAAYNNHVDIVQLLYLYGCSVPKQSNSLQSDLDTATQKAIKIISEKGIGIKNQFENHTTFGLKVVDGKQWRSEFFDNIFPPYKSHITWNRFLSPKLGIGLRIDGLGANFGIGFGTLNIESDSILRTTITTNNERKMPSFEFGPNVGVLFYFAPQQYSYLRLGLLLNCFDGPYKISDGYYFHNIGWFLAPNVELRFTSWDNSLSFESSFSYSKTDFQFCKLDNSSNSIRLQNETGDFYWFDFTLRYRPKRASEYGSSSFLFGQEVVSGIGFYVSFRPIYGKLQVLDKPRFFIGMLNLGIEWSITSISDLALSHSLR